MEENQYQILATEVKASLDVLSLKMDDIKEKQEEVASIVNRVEKSLYEPDAGLYARVRDLEQWKKNQSKMMAMVGTATLSMVVYFIKSAVEYLVQ
jgi:tetrahydromethanopterin S-methyltransferase subunit B